MTCRTLHCEACIHEAPNLNCNSNHNLSFTLALHRLQYNLNMKIPGRKRDYKPINIKTDTWYLIQFVGEKYAELHHVEPLPVATTVRSMAVSSLVFLESIVKGKPYSLEHGPPELTDEEVQDLIKEIEEIMSQSAQSSDGR